jgi:hypothetical protein
VLRGETFFERIYLTFLGEEGKSKEMAMAVAVGVEAVNKYSAAWCPRTQHIEQQSRAMFFSGKIINYESISTIDHSKKDKRGEIYRLHPANQFLN